MRLVGNQGMEQIRLGDNGPVVNRSKDGTFNVPDSVGKILKKSGDFGSSGVNFQGVSGHACPNCGRVNVYRDSCGGCGWSESPDAA